MVIKCDPVGPRARYTLEFLGTWEQLHNPAFKVVEFDHFKAQAGLPSFTLSVSEWIESTNAVGLIVKSGRYAGCGIAAGEMREWKIG